MQLKETEFSNWKYRRLTIISTNDSGLFAVQYSEDSKTPVPTFTADTCDWQFREQGETYRVRVPKPAQRKVLRSVIVMRTSANHYEVTYADQLGCERAAVKTMTAVHEFLTPLWRRELNVEYNQD